MNRLGFALGVGVQFAGLIILMAGIIAANHALEWMFGQ